MNGLPSLLLLFWGSAIVFFIGLLIGKLIVLLRQDAMTVPDPDPNREAVAMQLVRETIGEEAWLEMQQERWLPIKGKVFDALYYIKPGNRVEVYSGSGGRHLSSVCITPNYASQYPQGDTFVIQWLLCNFDEDRLYHIGVWNGSRPNLRR